MGLLDVFNSFEGQQALGLLAAAGGRSDGAGFGQRLMEGLSQGDKWKAAQAQEEMRKHQMQMQAMQIQKYQQEVADQKKMQEMAIRKQQALPSLFASPVSMGSASPAMLGDTPMFSGGMTVNKASTAGPTRLDVQRALAAGYSPKEIQELDALRNVGMDEVARTIDVEGANGGKTVRGLDKFGRPVFDQNGYVAPVSVNQGNQTTFVKPSAGLSLPMGMSPTERDASARGWASNALANKRFAFEQSGGADAGKPPAGYRWNMDKTGLEAIPGGPADIKAGELGAKLEAKKLSGIASADNVRSTISDAKNLVGFNTAGLGSWASKLPATDARDLAAKLETVKGNLGFDRLQQMRDQSPTGGALGAVAVQELTALQSTVASLDQGQSPSELRKALAKIDKHYENWQAVMRGQNPYDKPKPTQGGLGSGSFKILSVE